MWDRVAPELERMGILGRIDHAALEAYCVAYRRWREDPKPTNGAELRAWAVQLGLTPAARLRMTLPEAPDDADEKVFGRRTAR